MTVKEFRINEFIVLKLEDGKTNIYAGNHLFQQCKYILLNKIKGETLFEYKEKIKDIIYDVASTSIDIQSELLNKNQEGKSNNLFYSPEEEFWAHCSNIQAWVELKYDTSLLHSNLSFYLLKKLRDVGDPLAKRIFEQEIVKKFEEGPVESELFLFESGLNI